MRGVIRTVAVIGLIGMPLAAFAQQTTTTQTTTTSMGAPNQLIGAPMSAAPDPGNCGTPDAWKACPPMPRVPLQYYPGHHSPSSDDE